jgi:hypothetical protein
MHSALPLFQWAEQSRRHRHRRSDAVPLAARIVGRRYHYPANRARLLAELIGYSTEAN